MKRILLKIWKDAVWSKVIAAAVISFAVAIWHYLSYQTFNHVVTSLLAPYPVPGGILLLSIILLIHSWVQISKKRPIIVPMVSSQADVIAILDDWWPESSESIPKDVSVDFQKLEKTYNFTPGSVRNVIDIVAKENCFKQKFFGENYATYTYDLDKAFGG